MAEEQNNFDPNLWVGTGTRAVLELDRRLDAYSWLVEAEKELDRLREEGGSVEKAEKKLPGIYLVKPHAQWVAEGEKRLIGKLRPLPGDYLHRDVYVVDNDFVWGKVRVKEPSLVGVEEFDKREKEHRISLEERSRWWPKAENLYLYSFDLLESYADDPKPYKYKPGIQTVIREVKPQSGH